jgi:signal transduction histidine kinase
MIFTLIICLLTTAELYYWNPDNVVLDHRETWFLFSSFFLLMLLDFIEILVFPRKMAYAVRVFLFFIRVGLVTLIQYLDLTYTSYSLIGLIPYYTFFVFGGVVSLIFCSLLLYYLFLLIPKAGSNITLALANLLFMQIISFVTYHTQRVTLQNRDLLQELHQANTELQFMVDEIAELSAVEERIRLSRDLHDSVGHHLTAISIQLEKSLAYQNISENDSIEAVKNARYSAAEALKEVRNFIDAQKVKPGSFSLEKKINGLLENFDQEKLKIEWRLTGDENNYPIRVRRNLYHSLQELITNIHKHAEATKVDVSIKFSGRDITMRVEDNGVGFVPERALKKDGHFGLKHLKERISSLDGTLEIDSKKQGGTRVTIRVPRKRKQPYAR